MPAGIMPTLSGNCEDMTEPEVTVVIISMGRERLYSLVPAVLEQETPFGFEVLVIANGPVDAGRLPSEGVRLHFEESGRGIPYYRNVGTGLAAGSVIVYVDDDETLRDGSWLATLAGPVVSGAEKVTVGGAFIPQGQGFLADLVSMLGYPGGGSLGWKSVWKVDERGYTDKLCTCNCALDKLTLESAGGFNEDLALGASDLFLGEALMEKGIGILFVEEATVIHEARKDFRGFVSWQLDRGRSIYDLKRLRPLNTFHRHHVSGRMRRTAVILERTFPGRQFFPMLGILVLEFGLHCLGYVLRALETGDSPLRRLTMGGTRCGTRGGGI